MPRSRLSYLNHNKWSKGKPFAFLRDRWLYLINDPEVEYVTVEMVLEEPKDLQDYINCTTGDPCYQDNTTEYPISAWMWEVMKQMIFKANGLVLQTPTDISEDGNPNYKQPVQKPPIG